MEDIYFYSRVWAALATAFVIPNILTPWLISFSLKKGYTATINHRTSHQEAIPNTGGIMLFLSILIPMLFFSGYHHSRNTDLIYAAFAVLLITGVIDDQNPLSPGFKFLGQFIPAIVIVTGLESNALAIPFLQNLFEVPGLFNYLFWVVAIVFVVNAFNLIDGIDGLAICLGLFSSIIFSVFFWMSRNFSLFMFSLIFTGGLLGLLRFNLSKRRKIFIGDTGSLLIGGIISYFSLRYLCIEGGCADMNKNTTLAVGILFIPVADMLRVILERLVRHQSPFTADKTHLHHLIMARYHFSHLATTLIIVGLNALFFAMAYLYVQLRDNDFLPMIMAMFVIYFFGIRLFFKPKNLNT